jgi:hypothetical protein
MLEMVAGGHLGHDAAIGPVSGDLGSHFAREQIAPAQDGDRGFVAGGFEGENGHGRGWKQQDESDL